MAKFDPERTKQILLGDTGISFDLSADLATSKAARGLCSSADAFVVDAIKCLLVNFDKEASQLLSKASDWLRISIEERELPRMFEEVAQKVKSDLLVTVRWLREGIHDKASAAAYLRETVSYFERHPDRLQTADLGLEAVALLDSEGDRELLQLFEKARSGVTTDWRGAAVSELKTVVALAAERKPGPISQTACNSVRQFLDRHVSDWLARGHALRAARWMKVIYWQTGNTTLTPKETVLKCYDHLR